MGITEAGVERMLTMDEITHLVTNEDLSKATAAIKRRYGHTREIARTLAWAAAHKLDLGENAKLARQLDDHGVQLRSKKGGFTLNSVAMPDMLEELIHTVSFCRDYDAPHHYYQDQVKRTVSRWNETLHEQLTTHILDAQDRLEMIESEALIQLALSDWDSQLWTATQRAARESRWREYRDAQYAITRRLRAEAESERQLQELMAYEGLAEIGVAATHPAMGSW
jgi:hypothetical protein